MGKGSPNRPRVRPAASVVVYAPRHGPASSATILSRRPPPASTGSQSKPTARTHVSSHRRPSRPRRLRPSAPRCLPAQQVPSIGPNSPQIRPSNLAESRPTPANLAQIWSKPKQSWHTSVQIRSMSPKSGAPRTWRPCLRLRTTGAAANCDRLRLSCCGTPGLRAALHKEPPRRLFRKVCHRMRSHQPAPAESDGGAPADWEGNAHAGTAAWAPAAQRVAAPAAVAARLGQSWSNPAQKCPNASQIRPNSPKPGRFQVNLSRTRAKPR